VIKNWRGEELKRYIRNNAAERLESAAIFLKSRVKEELSIPSGKGNRSNAGEPPHKETGRLRASISHEVDKSEIKARVGTNVTYGKFLELGTRFMAARPFLTATLHKYAEQLRQIIKGKR
jgi:HK97 gp10 family phage protein